MKFPKQIACVLFVVLSVVCVAQSNPSYVIPETMRVDVLPTLTVPAQIEWIYPGGFKPFVLVSVVEGSRHPTDATDYVIALSYKLPSGALVTQTEMVKRRVSGINTDGGMHQFVVPTGSAGFKAVVTPTVVKAHAVVGEHQ